MTAAAASRPRPVVTIVVESLFGNTRQIAEAIADGIREELPVSVIPVGEASALAECEVLLVGAPTHAHSLSSPASRSEAERWARDPARHLRLAVDSDATGVREWLEHAPSASLGSVAFDTRVDMPRIFTGSAATAIARRLKKRGLHEIVYPESFLVDKDSRLLPTELDRAHRWGREIAGAALARDAHALPVQG